MRGARKEIEGRVGRVNGARESSERRVGRVRGARKEIEGRTWGKHWSDRIENL